MSGSRRDLPEELEAEIAKKIQAVHEGIAKEWAIPYALPELLGAFREIYLQTIERTVIAEHCIEKQVSWSNYKELRRRILSHKEKN